MIEDGDLPGPEPGNGGVMRCSLRGGRIRADEGVSNYMVIEYRCLHERAALLGRPIMTESISCMNCTDFSQHVRVMDPIAFAPRASLGPSNLEGRRGPMFA